MADYVYVGRSRHRVRIAIYQILTLGVYGRVWMYKLLREFDGHEALFLDRRPYVPLLVLPIVGPFFVKRRVTKLVDDVIHHDVTSPGFRRRNALLLGLIPLLPFFQLYVQKVVNHHWRMHTKQEELELRKGQLAALERRKDADSQAQAKVLAKDVAQRQKELEDLRSAALALREAEALRRSAAREAGVRRSPLAAVKKLGSLNPLRRKAGADEPLDDAAAPEPSKEEPLVEEPPKSRRKKEPEPVEELPAAAEESAEGPVQESKPGFFARFRSKRAEADEPPAKKSKKAPREPEGLSKDDIKALRQKAKDERKADKLAAKEEKRKAKQRRKDEKAKAKEARRAEKLARKAAKKEEKEKVRAAKQKEKERAKAKDERKKEKSPAKPKKGAKKGK
jgi:hypothetical protein